MKDQIVLQERKYIWKNNMGLFVSSHGASGGIFTVWNSHQFHLVASKGALHWMLIKLEHISSGNHFTIINVYVPNQYHDKLECWGSLLELSETESMDNLIIVGDFNTAIYHWEKRGVPLSEIPPMNIYKT
jgi:hypothetical protein